MKNIMLSVIAILALTTLVVGGTVAGFSDTEASMNNLFETASLDIKVANAGTDWSGNDFREDEPWGLGLQEVFSEECAQICTVYSTNLFLWNIGSVDGIARLHLRLTNDTASIGDTTYLTIWYDENDNQVSDAGETISLALDSLDCNPLTLGLLPDDGLRRLTLTIHPNVSPSDDVTSFELEFSTEFQLIESTICEGFTDTETSLSYLRSCGQGCTPGAWKNRLLNIGEWGPTGYSPAQPVVSVFSAAIRFPNLAFATLEDALWFQGGNSLEEKAEILLRAAVAAVLNAAHPGVSYPRSVGDIITDVNLALDANPPAIIALATALDNDNNLGCPF